MKKKLELNKIRVKSFVTGLTTKEQEGLMGGDESEGRECDIGSFFFPCESNDLNNDCDPDGSNSGGPKVSNKEVVCIIAI